MDRNFGIKWWKEKLLQKEHGRVTSRPLRKLEQNDQDGPTNRLTKRPTDGHEGSSYKHGAEWMGCEIWNSWRKLVLRPFFPACNWLLAIIKLLAYFIFKMLFTWQWLNLEWILEVFDSKKLISNMKLWFINAGLCKKNVIQNIKLWLNYILKYKEFDL